MPKWVSEGRRVWNWLIEIPVNIKILLGSILGAVVSYSILNDGEFFGELLESTTHNTFQAFIAVGMWVFIDRYVLRGLNIPDVTNNKIPATTRAGIAVAWGIAFYAWMQLFT